MSKTSVIDLSSDAKHLFFENDNKSEKGRREEIDFGTKYNNAKHPSSSSSLKRVSNS